jgi:hypothetical protein
MSGGKMTDYSDYEQWLQGALIDGLVVFRQSDAGPSCSKVARAEMEKVITNINHYWGTINKMIPEPEEE